jgi:hypothetical protein
VAGWNILAAIHGVESSPAFHRPTERIRHRAGGFETHRPSDVRAMDPAVAVQREPGRRRCRAIREEIEVPGDVPIRPVGGVGDCARRIVGAGAEWMQAAPAVEYVPAAAVREQLDALRDVPLMRPYLWPRHFCPRSAVKGPSSFLGKTGHGGGRGEGWE